MEETTSHNHHDFSTPQQQSPAAIIIIMLRSALIVAKTVWPALLVMLLRTKKEQETGKVFFFLLAFGVLTIVFTLINYFFYRFFISDNNLVIKTGWLKKKTLSIPLQNIQAVHLEQNIWQQVFGVYKVSFDSAGSEKVEAKIDALAIKKAELLKQILLANNQRSIETEEVSVAKLEYKLSVKDLLKLSITANHLEAFVLLFAFSINLIDDLKKAFNIDSWKWMEKYGNTLKDQVVVAVFAMLVIVAIISVIFSVFRTIVRYYNFTLADTNNGWKISFGLLNRQEKIIPKNKIQIFSWHANWFRRKINFWLLDIQTVGQLSVKDKQRLKVPLTTEQAAISLATFYQNSAVFNYKDGYTIDPAYWYRSTLIVGIPITAIITAIIGILAGWQSLWCLLLILYFAWYFYTAYKNFKWSANEEGLQTFKGVWGRRYSLMKWSKVQQVKMTQSPYQRSHQLASITFITAGGQLKLHYIPLQFAQQLVNVVLYLVESKNEQWM